MFFKDLQDKYMGSAKILKSDPAAVYCETVLEKSQRVALPLNKYNSIYMKAFPLGEQLVDAIEGSVIGPKGSVKSLADILIGEFDWDKDLARNIWCFGPNSTGPNILVNSSKGVPYFNVLNPIELGFQQASREGILAAERMRGVCIEVSAATSHSSASHKSGQIFSAAMSSLYSCLRDSSPRLMEPVYLVEIQTPKDSVGTIYTLVERNLNCRIVEENLRRGDVYEIKMHLPVRFSFGFFEKLKITSSGRALFSYVFSHWQVIASDPLTIGSEAALLALGIRKFKGMHS